MPDADDAREFSGDLLRLALGIALLAVPLMFLGYTREHRDNKRHWVILLGVVGSVASILPSSCAIFVVCRGRGGTA